LAGRSVTANFFHPGSRFGLYRPQSCSGAEIDLFASLEGIVNRTRPRIACVNRRDREGKFTWLDLHKLSYGMVSGYDAILTYRTNVTGLVVTDPGQPHTLNLATTMAGVNNELICDPSCWRP